MRLALAAGVAVSVVMSVIGGSQPANAATGTAAATTTSQSWTHMNPSTHPSSRQGAAMAYDAGTGQLILFGGATNRGLKNDTWSWNGTAWTRLSPPRSPSARINASMAYDAATSQFVLFGGSGGTKGSLDNTWLWNGRTWTKTSSGPSSGCNGLAYDAVTQQLLLFTGDATTWTWTGAQWSELFPASSPPGGCGASLAYDASTGLVTLF